MGVHLAKNHTGGLRALYPKRYSNSTFQIKTSYTSLPSFLNPLRGSIYYLNFFERVLRFQLLQYSSYCSVHQNSAVGQKKMYYFGDRPWASIVHFKWLRCIKLLLVSKLWVWCLAMVTVSRYPKWRWLMGEGPFVADICLMWMALVFCDHSQLFPNEGDRWVKAFPSYSAKDDCFAVHWLVGFKIQLTWYFLSEHGSETRHGKDQSLTRSSEVRVWLHVEWMLRVVTGALNLNFCGTFIYQDRIVISLKHLLTVTPKLCH